MKDNRVKLNRSIEAVYGLSPMQEGMLFHSILNANTTEYILQVQMEIHSEFLEENAKLALQLLMERYDVLRTSFTARTKKPLQIVRKTVKAEYNTINFSNSDDPQETIKEILHRDLQRGFDLEKDVLLRITHLTFQNKIHLIWTVHHIIIDGWCLSLLMRDFIKYYSMILNGNSYGQLLELIRFEKEKDLPYKKYIEWLNMQKDVNAIDYWKKLLEGYENAQVVPIEKAMPDKDSRDVAEIIIDPSVYHKLKELALKNKVTISTLIETAYGVLLQRLIGVDDVVIGKVVSGRDIPLQNVSQAIGLYINTIPSRITSDKEELVSGLLQKMQYQSNESMLFSYSSLADIQVKAMNGCQLAGLYAFENFYVDDTAEEKMRQLGITLSYSREKTNYPLTLRVYENNGLTLTLLFDENIFTLKNTELILRQMETVLKQMIDAKYISEITGVNDIERNAIRI